MFLFWSNLALDNWVIQRISGSYHHDLDYWSVRTWFDITLTDMSLSAKCGDLRNLNDPLNNINCPIFSKTITSNRDFSTLYIALMYTETNIIGKFILVLQQTIDMLMGTKCDMWHADTRLMQIAPQ